MEEGRSAFKMLTGKPTGKRNLGRPRRRWRVFYGAMGCGQKQSRQSLIRVKMK